MKKFRRTLTFLFFSCFILLSFPILSANGDVNGGEDRAQNNGEKPSLARILTGTMSTLRKTQKNSWEKVKAIVHEMQLKLSPPNLDFRGAKEDNAGGEQDAVDKAGEKMKDAAKKSTEVSKMTVEESAKSAAETVQKKTDKVKDNAFGNEESHDEL